MRLLETFINNRVNYIRIPQENPIEIDTIISNRIHNFEIYTEALALRDQLKPIIEAINMFHSDDSHIADATDIWLRLSQNAILYSHEESVLKLMKSA